jgi:hypothetical protein
MMRSAWRQADNRQPEDTVDLAFEDEDAVMDADVWMVVHPMEFDGTVYNLFGGWNKDVYHRVKRMLQFRGEMVCMERPMPDLQELLRPRAEKTEWNFSDSDWACISQRCRSIPAIPWGDEVTVVGDPSMVLGDSHSVAHYFPGYVVRRNDGLTLHGLIERDLIGKLVDVDELVVCAGNIDVRHHFGRHTIGYYEFAWSLISLLGRQLSLAIDEGRIKRFKVVELLPVEHEGRRVPKTGWYKGEPFFMPRAARQEAVLTFNTMLRESFGEENVRQWPAMWHHLDDTGKTYADRYMEKPGSVHLSPRWHRWDYEAEQPNLMLAKELGSC